MVFARQIRNDELDKEMEADVLAAAEFSVSASDGIQARQKEPLSNARG